MEYIMESNMKVKKYKLEKHEMIANLSTPVICTTIPLFLLKNLTGIVTADDGMASTETAGAIMVGAEMAGTEMADAETFHSGTGTTTGTATVTGAMTN
uniref:Uncharacterized protein n=1 Tax=Romanomermis culicivorax TaxID=13658 RepID=A0A915II56_ROMCU